MWRLLYVATWITFTPVLLTGFLTVNVKNTRLNGMKRYSTVDTSFASVAPEISDKNPLRVVIAGAGVGGLVLANSLSKISHIDVKVLEKTTEFKRFGGPIQLASNALQLLKEMDKSIYDEINEKFTPTGDKMNGIKDGIRTEWYAKFDLKKPALERNMPFTGVIDRSDLQEIYLNALPPGVVSNGDGVTSFKVNPDGNGVKVILNSGNEVDADVLIGADGIWSSVRATMRNEPAKGDGSGAKYSGYTLYAGELAYNSPDNGKVGYKVYIGPGQYFVITDIGNGNYQWYAFLARPPGGNTEKPDGTVPYLKEIFAGWSEECHAILDVTKEHEIGQRDLYDRPPSVIKPWSKGPVALTGDAIHAMMPNLGQGGCQAIEDAYVVTEELSTIKTRDEIATALSTYNSRRLIRSAAVQGLSRFASDIIIIGFDTPAKITFSPEFKVENFNYAGIVTKILQPIMPLFFWVQFNFLYDGYKNENKIDFVAAFSFVVLGGLILLLNVGNLFGVLGLFGLETAETFGIGEGIGSLDAGEGFTETLQQFFSTLSDII